MVKKNDWVVCLPTPEEVEQLKRWAHDRQRFKRAHGVQSSRWNGQAKPSYKTEITGMKGEFYAAQYCGAQFNSRHTIRGNGGVEFSVNDQSVDVKTAMAIAGSPHLILDRLADFKADVMVLAGTLETDESPVVLFGWIGKEEFKEVHFEHNFGKGERVAVTLHQLHPMRELLAGIAADELVEAMAQEAEQPEAEAPEAEATKPQQLAFL